jgi:hypothetical protein
LCKRGRLLYKRSNAFAGVKYKGHWFYILDSDLDSKDIFTGMIGIKSASYQPINNRRYLVDLSNSQILEIIKRSIRPEDIRRSFVYWYKKILKKGEEIKIGPHSFDMPFEGTIIFIDLAPRKNWAHPCLYMLVENNTLNTKIFKASFPPNIDQSQEDFVIVLRFGKKPPHERYFSVFY